MTPVPLIVGVTATCIFAWVFWNFYRCEIEKAKTNSSHWYLEDDRNLSATAGSLSMGVVLPFLIIALYEHTLITLLIIGGIALTGGLIFLAIHLGKKHGTKKVKKEENLKQENARLRKIIEEELDPLDSSPAMAEIEARSRSKYPPRASIEYRSF